VIHVDGGWRVSWDGATELPVSFEHVQRLRHRQAMLGAPVVDVDRRTGPR
jgi:hypothetical protein